MKIRISEEVPTLWNRYYFGEMVGHISESSVAKYIETYNSKSPFIPRLKPGEFPGINLKEAAALVALPEITSAYNVELKKLVFDKSKMPPIENAIGTLKNLHEILEVFDLYRTHIEKNIKKNSTSTDKTSTVKHQR